MAADQQQESGWVAAQPLIPPESRVDTMLFHLACVPTSMCAGRSIGSPQQKHQVPKEVRSEVIARERCQGLHKVHKAQRQKSREEDGQGQKDLSGAWHLR